MPPLGAYLVLGVTMDRVAEDVHELDDVLGDRVNAVQQRLGEAPGAVEQFAVLCDFVRRRVAASRVRVSPAVHSAVAMLAGSQGVPRVASVCRALSVSRKHLGALFSRHVGLSPKVYARMFRFRRVVDLLQSGRRADWAQIALSCGYYDQAHFSHEFRAFSGMTPAEYTAAESADGRNVLVTR
jgi:AraC-like DNA-binding protein